MHDGVMEWGESVLTAKVVAGKRVLEVGSCDYNGSLQHHVKSLDPSEFVGIDPIDGPGVDVIMNVTDLLRTYGPERWDVVLCTEMLEHCPVWKEATYQMKASLSDGGWLFVTTRSPGYPLHEFPGDYWRFTKGVMAEALNDLEDVQTWDDPGYTIARAEYERRVEQGMPPGNAVEGKATVHMPQNGVFARGRRNALIPALYPSVEAFPMAKQYNVSGYRLWPPK